jgi:protein tyrosine phosphatase (PTP) superfamily phosphohydrolase (DUF442 family)
VHLVETQRYINGRGAGFLVLMAQIPEKLVAGDGEITDPTFQEVPGERCLRSYHEIRRLGPVADLSQERTEPAKVLLIRPFLGPYLGEGESKHVLKIPLTSSLFTLTLNSMSNAFRALSDITNACQILPNVITGGQPTAAQLRAFRDAGGSTVLDIRDPMEQRPVDEPVVVQELGLEYVNVPVRAGSLDDPTLERILAVLRSAGSRMVFFHCGSGNRVGGALIPYFMLDQGMDEEDAIDQAMRVGLRSAEMMEWGLDYVRRNRKPLKR